VVEGDELRAQKRCNSKPLLMAPQSCAYIAFYPRETCGHPLSFKSCCDPERRQLMKVELVVGTSTHSINGRHVRLCCGD
jgi:hypothetical protein